MKLSFVISASLFVTGKASSPFDLKSSSEVGGCRANDCYDHCTAVALDALAEAYGGYGPAMSVYDSDLVRFTNPGNAPSCACGYGKGCCNAEGLLAETNAKCFGDDGKSKL